MYYTIYKVGGIVFYRHFYEISIQILTIKNTSLIFFRNFLIFYGICAYVLSIVLYKHYFFCVSTMNKYLTYSLDDFIWDDFFRLWALAPTREISACWEWWLNEYPEKQDIVNAALQAIQQLKVREEDISSQEISLLIQKTLHQIEEKKEDSDSIELEDYSSSIWQNTTFWWNLAASVTILVGFGWWVWSNNFQQNRNVVTYEKMVSNTTQKLIETSNETNKPLPVELSDGSLVILQKGSRISYMSHFEGQNREVFLSGEAFFEVSKDPSKPFLVYANGLVTKVLGTSFNIKAYDDDQEVTVEVNTGKVSVFAQSDPQIKEKASNRELEGVVLTPNQKIIYERNEVRMVKALVERPTIIVANNEKLKFEFEDAPVKQVFEALEKAYSVDIVFDEDLMANCPLTASLTDLHLFEKLDIICKAVEAHYEILDGQIVIYSKGCKTN